MGDMESIDRRLDALEAENRALRAKIVELETHGARKKIPVAPPEPQARVLHPIIEIKPDLPSADELKRLRAICARDYPSFCESKGYVWQGRGERDKDADEAEYLLQLERSLLALSNMRKLPKPDAKRYASTFVDHAQMLLRSLGKYTQELRFAPFAMACFCMGVPISGLGIAQCTPSLGLTCFDGIGVAIDPGAWRSVLKAGRLPIQHRIERIVEMPPQTRVVYGEQVGYRD
jgi:hypothetical protein